MARMKICFLTIHLLLVILSGSCYGDDHVAKEPAEASTPSAPSAKGNSGDRFLGMFASIAGKVPVFGPMVQQALGGAGAQSQPQQQQQQQYQQPPQQQQYQQPPQQQYHQAAPNNGANEDDDDE